MKADKKPALRLVLYWRPWKRGEYDSPDSTNYTLEILRVDPKDDKPRNCSRSSGAWEAPGTEVFDDLEISTFITWSSGRFEACMFTTRYHGYMYLDMRDLEIMVKGLKRAQKIAEAFPCRPQSFGQYVVLMAAGFGVKECCRDLREVRPNASYLDGEYQYLPLHYAQGWIDEEIEKLRKLKMGEEVAA